MSALLFGIFLDAKGKLKMSRKFLKDIPLVVSVSRVRHAPGRLEC